MIQKQGKVRILAAAGKFHGWALGVAGVLLAAFILCVPAQAAEPQLPPLMTVPRSERLPGKFVWADLVTDDVPAARKFYAQLFDWTFRDLDGYVIAANGDHPLCGMFQRPRPKDQSGQPRWIGYLSVPDVQKAQRAVTAAGGKVLAPARNLPERGEQAVFADAEGVVFGVIKSSSGDPQDLLADRGDWIWMQLLSRDGRKAAEFYRKVGGYEIMANVETNRPGDLVLASAGYARAAVRSMRTDDDRVRPTWLPFVRVQSVSESVTKAKQLGGKGLIEPKPELFGGKVALIADPTGAAIGILEWPEGLEKGGQKP
jgi:uncharacterized protein